MICYDFRTRVNAKAWFSTIVRCTCLVGDLLFFIKHGIFRAVSVHFSNNCMHAPYIVSSKILLKRADSHQIWQRWKERGLPGQWTGTRPPLWISRISPSLSEKYIWYFITIISLKLGAKFVWPTNPTQLKNKSFFRVSFSLFVPFGPFPSKSRYLTLLGI